MLEDNDYEYGNLGGMIHLQSSLMTACRSLFFSIRCLYLIGIWQGVQLRADTKITYMCIFYHVIGLCAHNNIDTTIIGSIADTIQKVYVSIIERGRDDYPL
jgi:hypothetical protein